MLRTILVLLLASQAPIRSVTEALLQLKTGKKEAIERVTRACRGKLRHTLRDNAAILTQLQRLGEAGDIAVARANRVRRLDRQNIITMRTAASRMAAS